MSELLSFLKKNSWLGFAILAAFFFVILFTTEKKFGFSGVTAQPYVIQSQVSGGVATTTSFFGDVNPQVDNRFKLGSLAKRWSNVFAGTLTASSTSFGTSTLSGDLLPDVTDTRNIGSSSLRWNNLHTTGTSVFGGAMQVYNGLGPGSDNVQIGWDQSGARSFAGGADTYKNYTPLNIYATTTGFQDTFTITAGGNGADGACFSAKNLGATLGRQCQTSSPLSYWIMSLYGLAFHSNDTTPYNPANVDLLIRNNNVGIGVASNNIPNAKLEVIGTASSTQGIFGGGATTTFSGTEIVFIGTDTTSTIRGGTNGKPRCDIWGDSDGSGVTYCTANDGVLTCSTTPCN